MAVRNRLSNDVQKRVVKYLTDDGEKSVDEIPQQVNVDELPASLQAEIKGLTDMLQQEIAPMLSEQTTSVQRAGAACRHREVMEVREASLKTPHRPRGVPETSAPGGPRGVPDG